MSIHVHDGITWKGLCDGYTMHLASGGNFYQAKSTDLVYNGSVFEPICDANYPWGFDIPNRDINIIGGFPNITFEHEIDFVNDGNNYDWGAIGAAFVVRTTIAAQVDSPDGDVWIRAYKLTDLVTPVWTVGPLSPGSYSNIVKDFVLDGPFNSEMKIVAQFRDGDAFQLTTVNQGGLAGIDWSGVPFPVDYASTD